MTDKLHKAHHIAEAEHYAKTARAHEERAEFHKAALKDEERQDSPLAELHKTLHGFHKTMHKLESDHAEHHLEMAKAFQRVPEADDDADKSATIDSLAKAVLRQIGNQIRPDGVHGLAPQDPSIRPVMRSGQRPLDAVSSTIKPGSNVDLKFEKLFDVELGT